MNEGKVYAMDVNVNYFAAKQNVSFDDATCLIVGGFDITKSTNLTHAKKVDNVEVMNKDELDTYFAQGTVLRKAVDSYLYANMGNSNLPGLTVLPIQTSTEGTPATATIGVTVSGTSGTSAAGYVYASIGDINDKYSISVTTGTSSASIVTDVVSAINADADCLFTAVDASTTDGTYQLTITAKEKGTALNNAPVKVSSNLLDVIMTTTAVADGTGSQVFTDAFDEVKDSRYMFSMCTEDIINNGETEYDAYVLEMNSVAYMILDQFSFKPNNTGTYATLLPALQGKNDKNSTYLVNSLDSLSYRTGFTSGQLLSKNAAYIMGVIARSRVTNAPVVGYVPNVRRSGDLIGGAHMASYPMFGMIIKNGSTEYEPGSGFSYTEVKNLLDAGCTSIGKDEFGVNQTRLGQMWTTYTTDDSGANTTFQYPNNVWVASVVRELYYKYVKNNFANQRVASGVVNVDTGRSVMDTTLMKALLIGQYKELMDLDVVENSDYSLNVFKNSLVVDYQETTFTLNVAFSIKTYGTIKTCNINFAVQVD